MAVQYGMMPYNRISIVIYVRDPDINLKKKINK